MRKRKHLIIGCGSAGLTALEQIRRLNSDDEIKLVTMEDFPPYSPAVIPYVLSGRIDEAIIPMRDEGYFGRMKATLIKGKRVLSLLPETKQVVYQGGEKETYDTLLIASGSDSACPPIKGLDKVGFLGFHTIGDCRELLEKLAGQNDVTVLGGGLVGMEVAIGLVERGCRVTIIEKEPGLLPLYFDQEAESLIRGIFLNRGVRLLTGREVSEVSRRNGKVEVSLSHGERVTTDVLVTCTGVRARTAFASEAGVAVNRGILVDRRMQTNIRDIYAAGDVAEVHGFLTGTPGMNPIILSACEEGKIAGSNMAGVEAEYDGWISSNIFHFFGNTAFSIGLSMPNSGDYEVLTAKDERRAQFKRVVYDGNRLVGAMFINIDMNPGDLLYLIQKKTDIGSYKQQLFQRPKHTGYWLITGRVLARFARPEAPNIESIYRK